MKKLNRGLAALLLVAPLALTACNRAETTVSVEAAPVTSVAQEKQVVIYSADWCAPCKQLKNELDRRDVAYTEYDVDENQQASDELDRLGTGALPTTVVGEQVIIGYNPDAVVAALAK
ncbi:MAG: glutaredoxin family protein [Porticoccaceae bacterium]|nr:glutaredoxin family protein [Porticoccaceae bacterium]